jgi:hypothetical protein
MKEKNSEGEARGDGRQKRKGEIFVAEVDADGPQWHEIGVGAWGTKREMKREAVNHSKGSETEREGNSSFQTSKVESYIHAKQAVL